MLATLTLLSVLVIDQVIKITVKTTMYVGQHIDVTPWCQICFTENKGMAFGFSFSGTLVLTLFRIIAVGFFLFALSNLIKKRAPMGLIFCWALVVAGAAGNIIDNLFYGLIFSESGYGVPPVASLVDFGQGYGSFLSGKVVDMFYFPFFTWPDWMPLIGGTTFFGAIFNFADAAISCGIVALFIFYRRSMTIPYLFHRP